jgi:hypothetical protein
MADVDQTIAAQVKVPTPPDVIGPIASLAQMQYYQAQSQRAAAETANLGLNTQFTAGKLQSLKAYNDAVSSGATPEDALSKSGLAGYDPAGANAILGNAQTGMTLQGNRAYAANPTNPLSAAPGGPGLVSTAATAASTQATTQETALKNATANAQLHGQLGNIMASDPSPQGRAQAAAFARQAFPGPQTEALIQQFQALPDDQYVAAGQHFQQASMTPEVYARVSGQEAANKGVAEAQTYNKPLGAGEVLAQGPLAHAAYAGQPLPPTGNPALGNFGPPQQMAPSLSNPAPQPTPQPAPVAPEPGVAPGPVPAVAPPAIRANLPAPGAVATGPAPVIGLPPGAPAGPISANYYGQVAKNESGLNPGIVNPNGGAAGLYQFMPATWASLRQSHPELGLTANGATDPAQATRAMQAFTADNAKQLSDAGIQVNDKSLRMAHFLGAGGATKFFQAAAQNPDASAASVFPAAAKQNPALFYSGSQPRSLSQLYDVTTKGFGAGLTANVAPGAGTLGMTPGAPLAQPGGSPAPGGLSNFLPIGGSAPILSPNLTRSQPGQPPLLPTPAAPIVPSPNAPLPVTPAAATGPTPPIAPVAPAPVAPQAAETRPAPVAAPNAPNAPQNAAAANPLGYTPFTQGMSVQQKAEQEALGRANAEMATAGPIEMAKGVAAAQVKQFADAKEAYNNANTAQMKINELQHSLGDLPSTGLLAPGSGATERVGAAKYVNTLLTAAGAAPMFDPKAVAAAESSQKITGGLGFDMSRTLGAREAAQIVRQAISLNPGVENTPQGAPLVAGAINAGLQRTKDFYEFLSQNGNKPGADIAFNRMYPVSRYVGEAQALAKIPQGAIDIMQQHPDSPTLAHYFEQHYGPGMSRYFTGQGLPQGQ